MKRDLSILNRIQEALSEWSQGKAVLPPSVEWLLDNAYLAAREGRMAERAFRRGRPLRRCRNGQSVLQCAARTALWAVPDLDRRRLTVFLSAFQSVLPLTERELSLLVPALTWALLCQLRGLCGDLAALREELGLNQPIPVQYVRWLGSFLQGDFGTSYSNSITGLMDYYCDTTGATGFCHDKTSKKRNDMASVQAFQALSAYVHYKNGGKFYWDLSEDTKDVTAATVIQAIN